jgi:hypothetical protein
VPTYFGETLGIKIPENPFSLIFGIVARVKVDLRTERLYQVPGSVRTDLKKARKEQKHIKYFPS